MSKANVYSAKGIKKGSYSLPAIFGEKENLPLLAQAVRVYEDRRHLGLAKAKTRAEIDRTKKKWYKQKGTGGARHGARSAPIFVGGGVAHGPKGVKRTLVIPVKMKRKALAVALSLKAKEAAVVLVDGLDTLKKAKDAQNLLNKIVKNEVKDKKVRKFTFVVSDEAWGVAKVLANIKNTLVVPFNSLNAYRVFFGGLLIFDKGIFVKKSLKSKGKK
ncbi:50S ribosomal protein L4 [Candidatus Woesebacteria bacterium RIFOXYC1_FULL_46_16]|uniref:Large ribosomal subunit protein uL4 n=1 Tax=Candidatus Woesebacteria bacterium RIFOXYC1_FULL_46_16 TaxID=1802546 RepID=A0A1F8DFS5_9BACT|nr:MAG: 50S ribosomal protein L4 [Candidatus Woesebacteria bacterium RIFOXYC1_FULL_46_16]